MAKSRDSRVVFALLVSLSLAACRPVTPTASPSPPALDPLGRLRADLDAVLAAPPLARSYWGVLVTSLDRDEILHSLNANKLMMPASTLKLVTMAAAVDQLGWDYTYETRLVATGPISDGVLMGDLLVIGSGDPSVVERDGMASRLFTGWIDALKSAGIHSIAGRIVGDGRAFEGEPFGFGWSWDDLVEGFAAGVSGLQYNENRAQVTIIPSEAFDVPPTAAIVQPGTGLTLLNRLRSVMAGEAGSIKAARLAGSNSVELQGTVPVGGESRILSVSIANPPLFFVNALRTALIAGGIDVAGAALDIGELAAPPARDGFTVVSYRSPPLTELLPPPMKFSVNLYDETLLKTLGAASGTATFGTGLARVRETIARWGVPGEELLLADGSGLSRYNYTTAAALVTVLTHVARDPVLGGPFEASLPVAGRDGTLANRMIGTSAEGKVKAKSGSMSNVRALAGYATTADGERLAFAILANNFEGSGDVITRAIDAVVVRLAQFSRSGPVISMWPDRGPLDQLSLRRITVTGLRQAA